VKQQRARWAAFLGAALWCMTMAPAQAAGDARVIVQLKADSELLRKQPLTADGRGGNRAGALGRRIGADLRAGLSISPRRQVMLARGLSSEQLAARLARDPDVEYAVPDKRRFATAVPNDPLFSAGPPVDLDAQTGGPVAGQWYLRTPNATTPAAIDAQGAWDLATGSTQVVVAVLDTGIRFEHPDLRRVASGGNVLDGYDFVGDGITSGDGDGWDANPSDPGDYITAAEQDANRSALDPDVCGTAPIPSSWHGTQVAGIIGATTNNGIGMAGVAPFVRVLPVRVLGKCGGFDSDIQAGIRWAAGLDVPGAPPNPNPAWVINLSLGSADTCSAAYVDAIGDARAAGAVVVASAGNSSGEPVHSPANCPGVIAVAGLRHQGTKVGFSSMGPEVSISAPAGNCVNTGASEPCLYPILTTSNSGTTTPKSSIYTGAFYDASYGTSFAAPLVSGAAALMLAVQPALTSTEVARALRSSSRRFPTSGVVDTPAVQRCPAPVAGVIREEQCYCTTTTCGAGMLDVAFAVDVAHLQPRIGQSASPPRPGQTLVLDADDTLVAGGREVASVEWFLDNGGGIVDVLTPGAAGTVSLVPRAAGTFTVGLRVTDSTGLEVTTRRTIEVVSSSTGGGGGGGAFDPAWLAALALAAGLLRRPRGTRR
jgi:serine protease